MSRPYQQQLGFLLYNNYMRMSSGMNLRDFTVLDVKIHFSNHLPLLAHFAIAVGSHVSDSSKDDGTNSMPSIAQLRWDHADLLSYCESTRILIEPIYRDLTDFVCDEYETAAQFIDCIYDRLVHALNISALSTVPDRRRNFYKFWWDQELDILKENAISSDKGWKSAGRPRSGPLFTKRNSDKRTYRIAIRKRQSDATSAFTNDLNDALLSKRGKDFWKCWNAKFERNSPLSSSIDCVTDQVEIVHNFADHFKLACTNLTVSGSYSL